MLLFQSSASQLLVTHDLLYEEEVAFSVYRISFPWYPFIGALIVWIIGIPLSHILGTPDDLNKLNPDLIAPQAKFLIPKRLLHVELPLSNGISDNEYTNEKGIKESKLENTKIIGCGRLLVRKNSSDLN